MNKLNKSFTIIEILISLSIFAVVAVTLYSTFSAGLSVWQRSGDNSDAYQDIRIVFDDMARDLKDMIYFTKDKESMFIFSGMPGEISLMTLEEGASEKLEANREVVRVTYSFDDTKGELTRQRADITLGFDIKKAEKDILLKGLEDFKFEYCYYSGDEDEPYLWQEEWKDEDMKTPRGIKITAFFKGSKNAKEGSKITRIIFIPTGILGKKEL